MYTKAANCLRWSTVNADPQPYGGADCCHGYIQGETIPVFVLLLLTSKAV